MSLPDDAVTGTVGKARWGCSAVVRRSGSGAETLGAPARVSAPYRVDDEISEIEKNAPIVGRVNGFPRLTKKGGGAMFWWRFWWLVMVAWCLHFGVVSGTEYVEQQLQGLTLSENQYAQQEIL